VVSGVTNGMSSTAWIRLELGGSRNSRWKWATPRNVPVGETNGGCVTKTWAAIDTSQSGSRMRAKASATVVVGLRMMTSGVMSPPAVPSP